MEIATSRSKSTLRAVCGELHEEFEDVDYYPSYEILTAQSARGRHYHKNFRNIRDRSVDLAIDGFIDAQQTQPQADISTMPTAPSIDQNVICEDLLLEGFANR